MQISAQKKWIVPLAIFGGLVLVLILSNREVKSPEDLGVIDTGEKYARALQIAQEMTQPIFKKADAGEALSDQEKDQLFTAGRLIDNANNLLPDRTIPFLGAGKAYMFAGDYGLAEQRFRQAINNVPFDKGTPQAQETGYEAHYRLSQLRFNIHDYKGAVEEATAAINGQPQGVEYYVARASALIQLKKYKEADFDLHSALKIEKDFQPAIRLHKLLEMEDPKTFGIKPGLKH
ncbi:MAG: tetratricopeptide repeat protein [Fimbriimonas sp.]